MRLAGTDKTMKKAILKEKHFPKVTKDESCHAFLYSDIEPVIGLTSELRVSHWNKPASELTRIPEKDALGLTLTEVFPLLSLNDLLMVDQVMHQKKQVLLENLRLTTTGKIPKYCTAAFYPLRTGSEDFSGCFAILRESHTSAPIGQKKAFTGQVLELLSNFSGHLTCRISPEATLLEVNELCAGLLGYQADELVGEKVLGFFHPDDYLAFLNGALPIPDDFAQAPVMYRLRHRQGHFVWFESKGHSFRDPQTGLLLEQVVILKPLPANTLVQPKNGSSETNKPDNLPEESLCMVLEASQTGVWSWNSSTEIFEFDIRMEQLLELVPGTFDGRFDSFLKMIPVSDRASVTESLRQAIFSKSKFNVDFRITTTNGLIKDIQAVGGMQFHPNGVPDKLVGLCHDITELTKNRQALLEKQHLIAKINDTSPFLTAVVDLQNRKTLYSSKPLTSLLGFVQEKKQKPGEEVLLSLLHPDDQVRLAGCLQQVSSITDYDVLHFLFRMRDRREGWRWMQVYIKAFNRTQQGLVKEVLCLVQEINESEQNKQLLKSMLDSSLSGIMAFESVRDKAGTITDFTWVLVNKPAEQLIGRKARNVMGKSMLREMPGNLSEGIYHKFVEVVNSGQPAQFEHYYRYKGCFTWFQISAVKMGDGFTATFTDITARKEAQQDLLLNKLFSEKIADNAPFMIGVFDLETKKPLYFNRYLGNLLGYDLETLANHAANDFNYIVHPKDLPKVSQHFAKLGAADDDEVIEIELRILDADDNWKCLHSRDSVFRRDASGNVIEWLTIVTDVSELKKKSNLLHSFSEASGTGVCLYKPVYDHQKEIVDFECLFANNKMAGLLGENADGLMENLLVNNNPKNLSNGLFATYVLAYKTGQTKTRELYSEKGGRNVWVRCTANRHDDGVLVLVEEITEEKAKVSRQRKHEILLREVQELAEKATELGLFIETPVMIWTANASGTPDFACPSLAAFTGKSAETLTLNLWEEILHEEDKHSFVNSLQQSVETGAELEQQVRIRGAQGDYKWYLASAIPFTAPNGSVLKWYGILTDIHAQKIAVQSVQQQQENRQQQARKILEEIQKLRRSEDYLNTVLNTTLRELKQPQNKIHSLLQEQQKIVTGLPDKKLQKAWVQMLRSSEKATAATIALAEVLAVEKTIKVLPKLTGLALLIEELKCELKPELEAVGAEIEYDLSVPQINIAPGHLRHILGSLIRFGIENDSARKEGFVILIRTELLKEQQTQLCVQFPSVEINQTQVEASFGLFFKSRPEAEITTPGLFTIKRLVEHAGGELTAESKEGEGLLFLIRLNS